MTKVFKRDRYIYHYICVAVNVLFTLKGMYCKGRTEMLWSYTLVFVCLITEFSASIGSNSY